MTREGRFHAEEITRLAESSLDSAKIHASSRVCELKFREIESRAETRRRRQRDGTFLPVFYSGTRRCPSPSWARQEIRPICIGESRRACGNFTDRNGRPSPTKKIRPIVASKGCVVRSRTMQLNGKSLRNSISQSESTGESVVPRLCPDGIRGANNDFRATSDGRGRCVHFFRREQTTTKRERESAIFQSVIIRFL